MKNMTTNTAQAAGISLSGMRDTWTICTMATYTMSMPTMWMST